MKIRNMEKTSDHGWAWIVEHNTDYGRNECYSYYTNYMGNGLWCNDRQCDGTAQFTLRGLNKRQARRKIYYRLTGK